MLTRSYKYIYRRIMLDPTVQIGYRFQIFQFCKRQQYRTASCYQENQSFWAPNVLPENSSWNQDIKTLQAWKCEYAIYQHPQFSKGIFVDSCTLFLFSAHLFVFNIYLICFLDHRYFGYNSSIDDSGHERCVSLTISYNCHIIFIFLSYFVECNVICLRLFCLSFSKHYGLLFGIPYFEVHCTL